MPPKAATPQVADPSLPVCSRETAPLAAACYARLPSAGETRVRVRSPSLHAQAPLPAVTAAAPKPKRPDGRKANAATFAAPPCAGASTSGEPVGSDDEVSFLSMLAGLPRAVLACKTKFSHFLSSTFHLQRSGTPAASSVLYPPPVPFPGVFRGSGPMLAKKRFERLAFKRGVHVFLCASTSSSVGGNGFPLPNFGGLPMLSNLLPSVA